MDNQNGYELIYPIIYNYRHAIELFLKNALRRTKNDTYGHELKPLLQKLKKQLKDDHKIDVPGWFESLILSLHEFDPKSTHLRYADSMDGRNGFRNRGEAMLHLPHLKKMVGLMRQVFIELDLKGFS